MGPRRLGFWVAVGGVAVLSNFLVELAAERVQHPGLRKFVAFTHLGGGS